MIREAIHWERGLIVPLVPDHSHPGNNDSNHGLSAESKETDIARRKFGFSDHIDGGMNVATEGLDAAGPSPVGRDEGLSDGFEEFW